MRPTTGRLISLIGIAAILTAGCGSDSTESSATTATAATTPAVSESSGAPATSAAPPATEDAPATTVVSSTLGPDTSSTDSPETTPADNGGATVLVAGDEPIQLRDGETVRFQTDQAAFEVVGQDGWLVFVTPINAWFTPATSFGQAWISIAHLKDGRPELGADGADLTGVAIPADPFITADQLALPDGTPIFENLRGLPDDWFAYVASLPGLAVGDVEPMSVGGIDGDGATYSVGDVPEAPLATCLDGVMSWVERTGGWCFSEQESGTLLITEIGGNRYELNVGTANDVAAADRSALDAMIASLVLV